MPRYMYDARQVRLLQREGQVVAAEEVDWSESADLLSKESTEEDAADEVPWPQLN